MLTAGNSFSVFAIFITIQATKARGDECFVTNSILTGRVLSLQHQLVGIEKNFTDIQNQLSDAETMFMIKLKKQEEEFNNTLQKIQTELEHYRQLNGIVEDLQAEINQTAGTVEILKVDVQSKAKAAVYFKVQLVAAGKQLNLSDSILIFESVVENAGNGYNQTTGIFTAPYKGLYLFAVTALSQAAKKAKLKIVKNRVIILGTFFTGQDTNLSSGSEVTVAFLEPGDEISVEHHYVSVPSFVQADGWTSFMGVLLDTY